MIGFIKKVVTLVKFINKLNINETDGQVTIEFDKDIHIKSMGNVMHSTEKNFILKAGPKGKAFLFLNPQIEMDESVTENVKRSNEEFERKMKEMKNKTQPKSHSDCDLG